MKSTPPRTHVVTLPREVKPQWPARCVVCGCDEPDGSVRLEAEQVTAWSWLWLWRRLRDKTYRTQVPTCKTCAEAFEKNGEYQVTFIFLGCLAGVAVVYWLAGDLWNDWNGRLWLLLGVIVGGAPGVWWASRRPQPVDVMCEGDTVTFAFTDADYARQFAEMHGTTAVEG